MKPGTKLEAAIHRYANNRAQQKAIPWDKKADLQNIQEAAFAQGFIRFEACAGRFWFSYQTPKTKEVKYITRDA